MSLRLSSHTSLFMFLQSTFQFGFLPSKPCRFSLKSNLEFILHCGKPKFMLAGRPLLLAFSPPMDQSFSGPKYNPFHANCTALFVFFSKSAGRNNAKYDFQYTFTNKTGQHGKRKKKKQRTKQGPSRGSSRRVTHPVTNNRAQAKQVVACHQLRDNPYSSRNYRCSAIALNIHSLCPSV